MSTVIAKNVQIGADGTASNNFTVYQPATPDGTLRIGNGNSGTTSNLVTVTSAGNVGIGTSSPTQKLQVVDAGTGSFTTLIQSGQTGTTPRSNSLLRLQTTATGRDVNIQFSDNVTNAAEVGMVGGNLYFATAGAERARIDSSGNLGLGVTPSAWGASWKALQFGGNSVLAGNNVVIANNAYNNGTNWLYSTTNYASRYESNYNGGGNHAWFTAPSGTAGAAISFTQAMTLDSNGNLLVGTTTNTYNARLVADGSADNVAANFYRAGTTSASAIVTFVSNAGGTRTLKSYIDVSSGALTTTSDESQKENLVEIENAAAKVCTLRAVVGNYIGDDTKHPFLIAQDVQRVLPEAVSSTPDGKLGMSYTDIIPLLVKAIQEQQAIITDLTARIEALEAK